MTRPAQIALALLLVGVLSAVPTRATPPSVPTPITDWRPIDRALHPLAYVPALRTSTGERGREEAPLVSTPAPTLTGRASWYAYVPGGAAAGLALRAWLGDWRGQLVTVTGPAGSLRVVLSDWCQCRTNPASVKVIDLAAVDFPRICGPLALGVCAVTIRR